MDHGWSVQRYGTPGEWGDSLSLQALADMFRLMIHVRASLPLLDTTICSTDGGEMEIYLYYHNNHYEACKWNQVTSTAYIIIILCKQLIVASLCIGEKHRLSTMPQLQLTIGNCGYILHVA